MTANQPVPPKLQITGVKHLIAVGSGKGGSARTDSDRANHRGDRTVTPSEFLWRMRARPCTCFTRRKVPILGTGENMSFMNCPHCHNRIDVFSCGGGRRTAKEMRVHFLVELPLDPEGRVGGDTGKPVALRAVSRAGAEHGCPHQRGGRQERPNVRSERMKPGWGAAYLR